MTDQPQPHFADLGLAQRLERAEGQGGAAFVEARADVNPEVGATWIDVGGTHALFDGIASPVTQTFCLGMFQAVTADDMTRIEQFFVQRGAPVLHEVSPLADASALASLVARGYQPFEFTSVMHRPIGAVDAGPRQPRVDVRLVGPEDHDVWLQTAADGWGELPEPREFMLGLAQVSARRKNAASFLASIDGRAIATGGLSLSDGVALFAGASTVPSGRKQGAQLALLEARLRYAAEHGCDLAMMCALPGSASQRNAERQGFRIAYTRIKWRLPVSGQSPVVSRQWSVVSGESSAVVASLPSPSASGQSPEVTRQGRPLPRVATWCYVDACWLSCFPT